MVGRFLVDEWSLPVGSVVADILEGGCDDAVKKESSGFLSGRCADNHLIHTFLRSAFHIPVECHPGSSPACESEAVVEMAAFPALFQEGKAEVS